MHDDPARGFPPPDPHHLPPSPARRFFMQSAGGVTAALGAGCAVPSAVPGAVFMGATPAEADATGSPVPVQLVVNGSTQRLSLDPRTTLLNALRDHLALTGTKKGCDRGQCGACTVLLDGRRVNACLTLAVMADGQSVTTIEGLGTPGSLHPMQAAFLSHDGFQCGYCTPGQICSAVAMLDEARAGHVSAATPDVRTAHPPLDEAEIRERMSGNLCRCGAYANIVAAVQSVERAG